VPNQYTSFSIIQEKAWYRWMTWPMLYNSTSFAMDDRYAEMRGCINGHQLGYFNSQSPASAADYSQGVQYATINPNGVMTHSHTKAILHSGETNLEYLAWGCLDTHYCGDWGMVAGCDRYAAEAYQHYINHDWPGGLYRTGRSPQLSNRPATR
jgi:hypothetical protein